MGWFTTWTSWGTLPYSSLAVLHRQDFIGSASPQDRGAVYRCPTPEEPIIILASEEPFTMLHQRSPSSSLPWMSSSLWCPGGVLLCAASEELFMAPGSCSCSQSLIALPERSPSPSGCLQGLLNHTAPEDLLIALCSSACGPLSCCAGGADHCATLEKPIIIPALEEPFIAPCRSTLHHPACGTPSSPLLRRAMPPRRSPAAPCSHDVSLHCVTGLCL